MNTRKDRISGLATLSALIILLSVRLYDWTIGYNPGLFLDVLDMLLLPIGLAIVLVPVYKNRKK